MAASMMCPNIKCRKVLMVPEEARGKVVTCSHCQTQLRVPATKPVKKSA